MAPFLLLKFREEKTKQERYANMISSQKTSIAVVDDDQGILDSFDAILGDDYLLFMANNGADAFELISKQNPRLLFLDIKIPRPNGLEVLKWIREKGISTTVVIVTAMPQRYYEEVAQQYGVYRYLHKPIDVDEVEEIASTVLQ